MAYTEFRKSYGDFEVVIPAVDFSRLTPDEAAQTIKLFHHPSRVSFGGGFMYLALSTHSLDNARRCIDAALPQNEHDLTVSIGDLNYWTGFEFEPWTEAGRILRQEWCRHMAAEIEREFGLEAQS